MTTRVCRTQVHKRLPFSASNIVIHANSQISYIGKDLDYSAEKNCHLVKMKVVLTNHVQENGGRH